VVLCVFLDFLKFVSLFEDIANIFDDIQNIVGGEDNDIIFGICIDLFFISPALHSVLYLVFTEYVDILNEESIEKIFLLFQTEELKFSDNIEEEEEEEESDNEKDEESSNESEEEDSEESEDEKMEENKSTKIDEDDLDDEQMFKFDKVLSDVFKLKKEELELKNSKTYI
jgi:hypothetical protein